MIDYLEWIRKGLEKPGKTQTGLAATLGRSPSAVTELLKGGRDLKVRELEAIADYLEADLPGAVPASTEVPVMGLIGGGAIIEPDFEQVPPEGLYQVTVPFAIPDGIIAFEIKGVSMVPLYDDKDVILVWKDQRFQTESYVGENVAVKTDDGRRFLKRLLRGPRRNSYTLESSPGSPSIEGVGIEWVGEIFLTINAGQLERIRARERSAARRRAIAARPKVKPVSAPADAAGAPTTE